MSLTGRIHDEVDDIHDYEEPELDAEAQEVAYHVGDGHYQTREINLSENAGILHEGIGSLGDTIGEVLPKTCTGKVEQWPWYSIGGDASDAAKYNHIHDDRKGRLYHEPNRAEYGLLVLGNNVALNEHGAEVAVLPQLLEIDGKQSVFGLDDNVPILYMNGCFLFCHITLIRSLVLK